MAELVDAQASGACGSNVVWVQVPSSALGINRIFAEEAVVSSANCLEEQGSFGSIFFWGTITYAGVSELVDEQD